MGIQYVKENRMQGLELARLFYEEKGKPLLAACCPEAAGLWAAGLVGEGSECFGFDDALSRDHDWGPGFCIWLTDAQYRKFGVKLQAAYDCLPDSYGGYRRLVMPLAGKRVGVFSISEFYSRFLGSEFLPTSLQAWLGLPETYLATATNGVVFEDGTGAFSDIRRQLLAFYPEDVRRKKLAARLAVMGQSGQYNYPRCVKRGDRVAAFQALARFMEAAVSALYLLKKQYAPYYKWAFRGLEAWPEYAQCAVLLNKLAMHPKQETIEQIADEIVWELRMQGLTDAEGNFLQHHAESLLTRIKDDTIRMKHILEG